MQIGGIQAAGGCPGTQPGVTEAGAKAMISAQSAKKLSNVQGHVAAEIKGKIRTLTSEIKEDASRGIYSREKIDALADLEGKKGNVEKKQIGLLAEAAHDMAEAVEQDRTEGTKEAADGKNDEEEKEDYIYKPENGAESDKENSPVFQTIDVRL